MSCPRTRRAMMSSQAKWGVGLAITLLGSAVGATWIVASSIADVRLEVADVRSEMRERFAVVEGKIATVESKLDLLISGLNITVEPTGVADHVSRAPTTR